MAKILAQTALIAAIADYFARSPEETKALYTPDGNVFSEKSLNHAEWHARNENFKVSEVSREKYEKEIEAASAEISKAAAEKAAAEKAAQEKEALAARAEAVGLDTNATVEQVEAAEAELNGGETGKKGKKK